MGLSWREKLPCALLMDNQDRRDVDSVTEALKSIVSYNFGAPAFLKSYSSNPEFEYCSCDEVFPNIYLGDGEAARSKKFLKNLGITHVVNAAMGDSFGMVDTNAAFYGDTNMVFKGFRMLDFPHVDITQFFHDSSNFIEDALASGGKVFVHCVMGVSRSATLVCAFLMMKRGFSAVEALRHIRSRRQVHPNPGFIERLANLDIRLRRDRGLLGAE